MHIGAKLYKLKVTMTLAVACPCLTLLTLCHLDEDVCSSHVKTPQGHRQDMYRLLVIIYITVHKGL